MKTAIRKLEALIRKGEKKLNQLVKEEADAKGKWYRSFEIYTTAVDAFGTLSRFGSEKHKKLLEKTGGWRQRKSAVVTEKRDEARRKKAEQEEELTRLRIELARLFEQDKAQIRAEDEIVEQVFELNKAVTEALLARNAYLDRHVYKRLIKEDGTLGSQVKFDNSSGTKRVIAMTNTITLVRPDLAGEALDLIEQFFERLQPKVQMDEATSVLFDLTKKLLVEKTSFKVGPDLYRFLGLELNQDLTPELKQAQDLLKQSLRSEKTSSYIKLFVRENRTSPWVEIKRT